MNKRSFFKTLAGLVGGSAVASYFGGVSKPFAGADFAAPDKKDSTVKHSKVLVLQRVEFKPRRFDLHLYDVVIVEDGDSAAIIKNRFGPNVTVGSKWNRHEWLRTHKGKFFWVTAYEYGYDGAYPFYAGMDDCWYPSCTV